MFKDAKDYVAPSVTVLSQLDDETVVTSGDAGWGFDDNIFDLD